MLPSRHAINVGIEVTCCRLQASYEHWTVLLMNVIDLAGSVCLVNISNYKQVGERQQADTECTGPLKHIGTPYWFIYSGTTDFGSLNLGASS